MSHQRKECISRGCFELNLTALPTDKFQLIEEHDLIQRNLLEVHSSHHIKECIRRGCFELNITTLPTDKFQLTEEQIKLKRTS